MEPLSNLSDPVNSQPAVWEAREICRSYGRKRVLQSISYSLNRGQVLGLFGPNGSGKTTLLEIAALASKPSAGQLLHHGEAFLTRVAKIRPLIGYVPQDIALFEELTVMDNLRCWSRLPRDRAKVRIVEVSALLNLEAIIGQRVMTLSGGMKRRVNLAVAMLGNPSLLVLDEPFAGVDYEHQEIMRKVLARLSGAGVSQIISSHHVDDLLPLLDQIMVLRDGRLLYYGSRDDFCRLPVSGGSQQTLAAILNESVP